MDPDEPPGFLNVAQIHWQIKKSRILNHLSVLSRGYICNMYPMESRLCFIGISCEFLVVDCWWSLWPHFEIYDASWVFLKITVPQTLCAEHIVASSFLWSTFIIWDIITTYIYIHIYAQTTLKTPMLETYIYTYITSSCISPFSRSSSFSLSFARQMIAKSYAERFNACSPPKKVAARWFFVWCFAWMLWMDGEYLLNNTEPLKQFQGFIKNVTRIFPGGIKQAAKLAQIYIYIYMVISSGISLI